MGPSFGFVGQTTVASSGSRLLALLLAPWALALAPVAARSEVVPTSLYRLGEADPGSKPGSRLPGRTQDSVSFQPLSCDGGGPRIASDVGDAAVQAMGSTLSVVFIEPNRVTSHCRGPVLNASTDNFGMEAWVKTNTASGDHPIAHNGDDGANGWGLVQRGGTWQALFGGVTFFAAGEVSVGRWTHLALVRVDGKATLYVDGVAKGTTTAAPNPPAGSLWLARGARGDTALDGVLDEVRLFDVKPGTFAPTDLLLHRRTVTTTADAGPGSLRQAIASAVPGGTVDIATTGTITLAGPLLIRSGLTLTAPRDKVTVSGAKSHRVFFVDAPGATVTLRNLRIADGLARGGNGGAGHYGGGGGLGAGGGLFVNAGQVVLTNVDFSGNAAVGGRGGDASEVGGGGGGGGLGGDGGSGSGYCGGGGGGFLGAGGDAGPGGGGGGGGFSGRGGGGSMKVTDIADGGGGGGGGALSDGRPGGKTGGTGADSLGGNGGTSGHRPADPDGKPGAPLGGGGGGGYGIGRPGREQGGNGGAGGRLGGGGGANWASEGGNGGDLGGGGGALTHGGYFAQAGSGGFGGGGGGANMKSGNGGFGGGAGASPAPGHSGTSGPFAGAPGMWHPRGSGAGGAALGASIFVRGDNGGSLIWRNGSSERGTVTGGAPGQSSFCSSMAPSACGSPASGRGEVFLFGGTTTIDVTQGYQEIDDLAGWEGAPPAVVKSGDGMLTLRGDSTDLGSVVFQGWLRVNGRLGTQTLRAAQIARLLGTGVIAGPVTLDAGSYIVPGDPDLAAGVGKLEIGSLTWHGGGTMEFQLGRSAAEPDSDRLVIDGGLSKVGKPFRFVFLDGNGAPTCGTVYTLMRWTGASGFAASDFSYAYRGANPTFGSGGVFTLDEAGKRLQFSVRCP